MEPTRRTYIYYSDEKIIQQQQQTPQGKWDRAKSRLNQVGISVLGSGVTVGLGPPAAEIISTMHTVWQNLADEGRVGSFDEPKEYVHGKLLFKYGFFNMVMPPVFFLVGTTERTLVALGGAQKHVRSLSGQQIPVADEAQTAVMEPDVATLLYDASVADSGETLTQITPSSSDEIHAVHAAMLYNNRELWRNQERELEVLAHQELFSRVPPPFLEPAKNVLIGSPIFVALA